MSASPRIAWGRSQGRYIESECGRYRVSSCVAMEGGELVQKYTPWFGKSMVGPVCASAAQARRLCEVHAAGGQIARDEKPDGVVISKRASVAEGFY